MDRDIPNDWMWSQAFDMLARAERMHREIFRPSATRSPVWEPPVDVLETPHQVLVLVALPGVSPEAVTTSIEGNELIVAGARLLPPEWATAIIHRLELPQGRFERRVRLPGGRYRDIRRSTAAGCLLIALNKVEAQRG
jgi:HSP20 family molecular chaperone IbpA